MFGDDQDVLIDRNVDDGLSHCHAEPALVFDVVDHDQEIDIAVVASPARGLRPEQDDPARPEGVCQPAGDLGQVARRSCAQPGAASGAKPDPISICPQPTSSALNVSRTTVSLTT